MLVGRITKIKMIKDKIEIHYQSTTKTQEKQTRFVCTEKPHPNLELAFGAMVSHVYHILDLRTAIWSGGMRVTGVSFSMSEETGVEGAVITGLVELETCNAPFCFNTPHLPFEQYSPTGNSPVMPEAAVRDLMKLKEEAALYMDGSKRAQMELAGTK